MQRYPLQTAESAPEECKPILRSLEQKFGFLPNALATMANSPVLLKGFVGIFGSFHGGGFNECEKQILLLTNAVTIKCPWTVAVHSTFALEDGVAESEVQAIRDGELPKDPKFAALSALTKAMIETKGNVSDAVVERFVSAGYSKTQLLEVVAGVGVSTTAATTANFGDVPIEDRLRPQAWSAVA